MTGPVVGFAGLTHLGVVSAAATAAVGFRVIGFDPDVSRARDLAEGRTAIVEPGLDALLREYQSRLRFTAEPAGLGACDVLYVASDVPTDDRGQSDLAGITRLIDTVIAVLGSRTVLVVLCQVPPGFTRGLPVPGERDVRGKGDSRGKERGKGDKSHYCFPITAFCSAANGLFAAARVGAA